MLDNKVFICIPVYNRIQYTLKCIDSIKESNYTNYEIIICDDGSSDDTSKIIKNKYSDVVVLNGDGNLWWAGATNKCIEYALNVANEEDYIYTLNNDTEISTDTICNAIELSKKIENSVIGSLNLYFNDHSKIEPSSFVYRHKYIFKKAIYKKHNIGEVVKSNVEFDEVVALSGKGVLIPIKVIKLIGLYNNIKLPHYYADLELTYRAYKAGCKVLISYKSQLFSHVEQTGLVSGKVNYTLIEYIKSFFTIKSPNHLKSIHNLMEIIYDKHEWFFYFSQFIFRIIFGNIKRKIIN